MPAASAASNVAYVLLVCRSTWSRNRPSGGFRCEGDSAVVSSRFCFLVRGAVILAISSLSLKFLGRRDMHLAAFFLRSSYAAAAVQERGKASRSIPSLLVSILLGRNRLAVSRVAERISARQDRVALLGRLPSLSRQGGVIGHRNRQADQFLDVTQKHFLFRIAKGDGDALCSGPRCAAYAVHICLRHVWKVEIDHVADAVD